MPSGPAAAGPPKPSSLLPLGPGASWTRFLCRGLISQMPADNDSFRSRPTRAALRPPRCLFGRRFPSHPIFGSRTEGDGRRAAAPSSTHAELCGQPPLCIGSDYAGSWGWESPGVKPHACRGERGRQGRGRSRRRRKKRKKKRRRRGQTLRRLRAPARPALPPLVRPERDRGEKSWNRGRRLKKPEVITENNNNNSAKF